MISNGTFMIKKDGKPNSVCFCRNPELIENYDKAITDTTQIWQCHHRLETHNSDGERRLVDLSKKELVALDMYYDRPPEELIFLTEYEHVSLHMNGRALGEKTKAKISASQKGNQNAKGKHRSEETKAKIRAYHKGKHLSEEAKVKLSTFYKGKHWKLVDGKRVWY